jgi:cytochrome bd ubiquinol oxidase subunit II
MVYVVIIYLWTAILLYLLFGGADFGAGIIELFTSGRNRGKTRKIMYEAIGPIWEANHMWLIIVIVILFIGFPAIYATISTNLHIPLIVMLLGITARGTAFAFRNYDAVKDDMQWVYNRIFAASSFITPLFLGIIAGSAVSGRIDPSSTGFFQSYIFSWLNFFSMSVGFFTAAICGYLAAVFIIGETDNEPDRKRFIRKARMMNIAAAVCGTLVFIAARVDGIPISQWLFGNPVSILAISGAALSVAVLWYLLVRGKTNIPRVLAGFQVTMILLATTYVHYPRIVLLKNGRYLSLLEERGEQKSMDALGITLLAGSLFILPALIYLIYSFQKKSNAGATH